MKLQLIGCSHQNCSVEIREQLAVAIGQIPDALARFQQRFPAAEAVLLSTCNRTELYTAADNASIPTPGDLTAFLADLAGLDTSQIESQLFSHAGDEAIRHLFTVAASLDSMVLGESQILSQVKEAYRIAANGNSAGQLTHSAFQSAIRVAKRVANETAIHRNRVSIPSVAIGDFARDIFERLDDKSVLLVGAGEMAEESLRYLQEFGAHNVNIINRSPENAAALAEKFVGTARPWEDMATLMVDADIVVSTTAATEHIMTGQQYREIESQRHQRPLFIVDLAIPRDFDPEIGSCLGVYLYSIDDLSIVCERNRIARKSEMPKAHEIIEQETDRFMAELRHKATGPTIRRLRESAGELRDAELKRLLNKVEVDDATKKEIQRSFDRLVNKILHPPLESLKENTGEQEQEHLLETIRRLFRL